MNEEMARWTDPAGIMKKIENNLDLLSGATKMAKSKTNPVYSTAYLDPELIENLHIRLNRIEGHVRGVKRMLEEEQNCDDILVQLSAVRAAVTQVMIKLFEGHMETCVRDCVRTGDTGALEHLQRSMSMMLKNSP